MDEVMQGEYVMMQARSVGNRKKSGLNPPLGGVSIARKKAAEKHQFLAHKSGGDTKKVHVP